MAAVRDRDPRPRGAVARREGGGPLTGTRGRVARFAVRLRNRYAAAVPFVRCPLLVEALVPAGRSEVHQLNCRAALSIPPKGARTFEMRIHVPADARVGANGLFWELDPLGARAPEVVSRLQVTR